ncbi:MAG: ferrous iron transporter B [Candidatus Hodarchaeaceae archaeon]|nr:ferrous iron transporter B [Candidatus Hodarchaeaceae archaeon]
MRILLMGNPNVGKSVVFSRLTGTSVVVSNYPGTTVEFTKGTMKIGEKKADVIDVPGTYTLEPTTRAEEVAVEMLKEGDVVIDIVDATNLERNLYLTLQLLEKKVPVIVALNLSDEAKHKGITIDVKKLEKLLDVPVVPTVAITGEGLKKLVSRLPEAKAHAYRHTDEQRWEKVGKIVEDVQSVAHRHHTLAERLGDATVRPLTGIPIAIGIVTLMFLVIRFIGEGLIANVFDPAFGAYEPVAMRMSEALGSGGLLHNIVIGNLIDGGIDFTQSMGLLTTGIFVPFAMVLPYVFAFYLVLGFLEDSGYLPRLGVLVDSGMHRVGMHGLAVVPMLLGLGCNVPGALSSRILETQRQRFIALTLMGIAVPCMAQLAIIFGLVGPYGIGALAMVFATLFVVWVVIGLLLNKVLAGESPEMFTEIPPYRMPYWGATLKKLWMRIRHFLTTAIPFVLLGVLLVNVLYTLGIIDFMGDIASPVVVGLLGLPPAAAGALIIGFLRKDVAVGMLLPLGLSMQQLVVASVVLAMYFPCVATFAILFKEFGIKGTIKSTSIMIGMALLVGTLLRLVLGV